MRYQSSGNLLERMIPVGNSQISCLKYNNIHLKEVFILTNCSYEEEKITKALTRFERTNTHHSVSDFQNKTLKDNKENR